MDKSLKKLRKNVRIAEATGCWEWTKQKTKDGYGRFMISYKSYRAHRASWEIHHGPIPEGMCVLHKCDNPSCVNPDHLFLGTQQDNMKDMRRKGRGYDISKCLVKAKGIPPIKRGESNGSAKITDRVVHEIRSRYKEIKSQRKLSVIYGVARSQIQRIVNNKAWTHI